MGQLWGNILDGWGNYGVIYLTDGAIMGQYTWFLSHFLLYWYCKALNFLRFVSYTGEDFLDLEALRKLIQNGETSTVEFKIAPPRNAELAERICGFANSDGGLLIMGVEDKTWQIVGLKKVSDAIDTFLQAARLCKPTVRLNPPEPEIVEMEDGKVLVVAGVAPNEGILYQAGGVCWIRRGTHTVPLEVAEIEEFLYSRGNLAWERRTVVRATLDDLNLELVKSYLEQRPTRSRLGGRLSNLEEVLINLGCAIPVRDGINEIVRPTNAGMLLFGINPQLYLMQSEVICMFYGDNLGLRRYLDRRILHGTITQQIDQVAGFFEQHVPVAARMDGFHRIDLPDYPLDALREATVNALAHRDYSTPGEAVRVFYYADRIELHNPGILMPGLKLEELKQGRARSKPRNPIIAGILRDMPGGYMERVGSGINYMINQMRELGQPDPEFREQGEFIVTFWHSLRPNNQADQPVNLVEISGNLVPPQPPTRLEGEKEGTYQLQLADLLPTDTSNANKEAPEPVSLIDDSSVKSVGLSQLERQELALRFIQKNGSITNKQYRAITGTSDNTALRDLEALVEQRTLRAIGNRRGRKYIL